MHDIIYDLEKAQFQLGFFCASLAKSLKNNRQKLANLLRIMWVK